MDVFSNLKSPTHELSGVLLCTHSKYRRFFQPLDHTASLLCGFRPVSDIHRFPDRRVAFPNVCTWDPAAH